MRRTLAVHASAKAAFFMLNIENTAFADVYTAHLRLRYDEGTAKVRRRYAVGTAKVGL